MEDLADPGLSDDVTRRTIYRRISAADVFIDRRGGCDGRQDSADSFRPPVIMLMGDHGPRAGDELVQREG